MRHDEERYNGASDGVVGGPRQYSSQVVGSSLAECVLLLVDSFLRKNLTSEKREIVS